VRDHLQKLGGHLGNAQKQFVDTARAMDRFQTKLEAIERKGEEEVPLGGPPGTGAISSEREADQPTLPGTVP
jgi:hypothetical protein